MMIDQLRRRRRRRCTQNNTLIILCWYALLAPCSSHSISKSSGLRLRRLYDSYGDGTDEDWGDYEADPLDSTTESQEGSSGGEVGGENGGYSDSSSGFSSSGGGSTAYDPSKSSYGTDGYGGGGSDGYGGGSDSYSSAGYSSSSGGGSDPSSSSYGYGGGYDSGSSSYGGGSDYSSSSGYGDYDSGSSSSYGTGGGYDGTDDGYYYSKHSHKNKFMSLLKIKVPLVPLLFFFGLILYAGMLCTAHQFETNPEGTYTNCCRLSVHTARCVCKVFYNVYHCRLGEIPPIVCAADLDEEDYTDDELERMKVRPQLEKALQNEHNKAMKRTQEEETRVPESTRKLFAGMVY